MNADLWLKLLPMLENRLEQGLYTLWIKPLTASCEGNRLELQAPNEFVASWVRERLLDVVREAAQEFTGRRMDLSVTVRRPSPVVSSVCAGSAAQAGPALGHGQGQARGPAGV